MARIQLIIFFSVDDRRGDNNRGYGFGGEDNFDRSQMRSSTAPREEGSRYGGDHRDGGRRDRGDSRPDRSGYGGGGYTDRYGGGRGSPAEERGKIIIIIISTLATLPSMFCFIFFLDGPKERPKLNLTKRSAAAKENDSGSGGNNAAAAAASSIFGGAKPVDTTRKEKEIEDKLKSATIVEQQHHHQKQDDGPNHKKPQQHQGSSGGGASSSSANIFGAAKPVDTTAREREIEERLRKERDDKRENVDSEKGQKDEQEG